MATLVLGAVGTLVGGPLGGVIGTLAGRQLDNTIIGSPAREGGRLSELSITTSSYGQPIPRHFGSVRAPGTIFWATDLQEKQETSGGGKGKPKTTTYSYSVSFAVLLSSVPIQGIGRIWADGNLLRGAAGDLKVAGSMRFYNGYGDQTPDPLIASAQNGDVPAMRGGAYVVFEDLSLSDFGNRIPTLSFEIFERTSGQISLNDLAPDMMPSGGISDLDGIIGFSDSGGSLSDLLGVIDEVIPINCTLGKRTPKLSLKANSTSVEVLPEPLSNSSGDTSAKSNGPSRVRNNASTGKTIGIRYYDRDRDYQIGVQRSRIRNYENTGQILEFPATTNAANAQRLSQNLSRQQDWLRDRILIQIAEIDPSFGVGQLVEIPDRPGVWRIRSWEWMERGVEMELERTIDSLSNIVATDSGVAASPIDQLAQPTQLWVVELPPTSTADATSRAIFAATTGNPGWTGAALYADIAGTLTSLNLNANQRSTVGTLVEPLAPSSATHFEASASILVDLIAPGSDFQSASIAALSAGSNRLYLDGEIIQFHRTEQISESRWQLSGLLRGRGGTEHLASHAHNVGALAIALDSSLVALDSDIIASNAVQQVAAIGLGDPDPAYTVPLLSGVSTAPLAPVHPRVHILPNGDWHLCWTRRSRGSWHWPNQTDVPLVEESEKYVVAAGSDSQPLFQQSVTTNETIVPIAQLNAISTQHGPTPLWVKQVGTHDHSPATLLGMIT